jgi:hypothetical protein
MADVAQLFAEIARVVAVLPRVEADRRAASPQRAARAARLRALRVRARTAEARERLRRAIAIVDGWVPGGGNCLRRSLLEMSLDRGAASERLLAGFKTGGAPASGHAWLESQVVTDRYDAIISI